MTTYGWQLRRIVEPLFEPVTLEEAKQQCQLDADIVDQDSRILGFIRGAREMAESYIKGSIIEQTWRLTIDRFPTCDDDFVIRLPNGPVIQVLSLKYYDPSGIQQTLTEDVGYQTALDDDPPVIAPGIGTIWPSTQSGRGGIEIQYLAGYASQGSPAGADGVPQAIKEAILSRVASKFHQREDEIYGSHSQDTYGFERTLDPYRRYP